MIFSDATISDDLPQKEQCFELLSRAASHVTHGYWNFPQYIRDYMDRFMGDAHTLCREDVLSQLRLCEKKPPCWFIHEFALFRATSPDAPPYDHPGFIHGPNTCPLRLNNAHCAHSNVLWLVLRALILLKKEHDAQEFLEPFFKLMVHDGQFATIVHMGNQPYLMESSWIERQRKSGDAIMTVVTRVISLLE